MGDEVAPRAARHRRSVKRRALAGVSVAAAAGIAATATMTTNAEAAWTSTWNVSASGWTTDDSPTVSVDRQGGHLRHREDTHFGRPGSQVDTRPTSRFTVIWQQESFPYTIKSVTGP